MASIYEAIDLAQSQIEKMHDIQIGENAKNHLITDKSLPRLEKFIPGIIERLSNCLGCVILNQNKFTGDLLPMIYFKPEVLNQFNEAEEVTPHDAWITVFEEVSHFCFVFSYHQKFGTQPNGAMTEMIAAIDEYIMLRLAFARNGNDSQRNRDRLDHDCFSNSLTAKLDHTIGYSLAREYIYQLDFNAIVPPHYLGLTPYREFFHLDSKSQFKHCVDKMNIRIDFGVRKGEVSQYILEQFGIQY
jgi:hypothetical protein